MQETDHGFFRVGIVNSTMTQQMNIKDSDPIAKNHKLMEHKMYHVLKLENGSTVPKPRNYICVERNDAFQIKMECTGIDTVKQESTVRTPAHRLLNNNNYKGPTYGAVLYLNGQRVHGKKTMRKWGWFQGFKKGQGQFSQFLFSTPQLAHLDAVAAKEQEESQARDQRLYSKRIGPDGKPLNLSGGGPQIDEKHRGKRGTIIIEFYRTKEFERPAKSFRNIHQKTYEQHFISDQSKKSFNDSLTIKEGNTFYLPLKHSMQGGQHQKNRPQQQHQQQNPQQQQSMMQQAELPPPQKKREQKAEQKMEEPPTWDDDFESFEGGSWNSNCSYSTQGSWNNRGRGASRGGHTNYQNRYRDDRYHGRPQNDKGRYYNQQGGYHHRPQHHQHHQHQHHQQHQPELMSKDFEILWERGPCDQITIYYADWPYLQLNGLVNVETNYDHIKLAPKMLVESQEFMIKCLQTIIRTMGKLHYLKCDEEFLKATGGNYRISDFFEFEAEQMKDFLLLKRDIFAVDDEGFATVINAPKLKTEEKRRPERKQVDAGDPVIELD